MRRKLIAMVLIVGICIILCVNKMPKVNTDSRYFRDITDTDIFVDYEENVMYTWYQSGCGAGMTVMEKSNGLPKLYDKTTSMYKYPRDIAKTTIYVDYEEMVMYTWCEKKEGAGLSIMLKADGLPKTYDNYTSIYTDIKDLSEAKILVDEETKVMYAWLENENGCGDLSAMMDKYGFPKLYDKLTSTYKNVEFIADDMIFVDEKAKVMYIWYCTENSGGLSVRINADGTPKKLEKFIPFKYMMKNIEDTTIFVDYEEDVKYLWCKGYYSGGLAVMPNVVNK